MSIRSYVSDLTVRIPLPAGSIETHGRLLPLQKPDKKGQGEGSYKLCTKEGVPIRQAYVDPTTNKIVDQEDIRRYIKGDRTDKANPEPEVKQILSPEEWAKIEEAKKCPLPKNVLELTIHPPEAVNDLWPTSDKKKSFVFAPDQEDPRHVDYADAIRAMVDAGYVLLALANLNGHEGFYRLTTEWRGQLVLQAMTYADELNPHEVLDPKDVDSELAEMALGLAHALCRDFNSDDYRNQRLERVRAIEAAATGEEAAESVRTSKDLKDAKSDLKAMLDSINA